ncbi:MAG: MlaD family protein [Actinomycetes bacterium]
MQKQAPTLPRILVMAGFALSCFGLILFLWVAFGGPVPFAAKGYQVKVNFVNAGQLASQADVRISGVPVGKVAKVELGARNATTATLQIDPRYAPIPQNSRAILRTKTLLGETYVELTPGNRATGAPLADGAMLPERQVRQQVTVDRIFQLFDEPTRKGFQEWQQGLAGALAGRGGDISDAFGNLPAFTDSADRTLEVLNSQGDAVNQLVRDTGVVFNAISERGDQLRQSIVNSNAVFTTTARLNTQLADIFTILPTFESEGKKTVDQLKAFSENANPVVESLIPAAQQISPTLESVAQLSPSLKNIMTRLKPLDDLSTPGTAALGKFLNGNGAQPGLSKVLAQLDVFLQQLNPMLNYLGIYKKTIPPFFANAAAATQATVPDDTGGTLGYPKGVPYLRASPTFNIMGLAAMPKRPTTNRATAYYAPAAYPWDLTNYETRQCGGSFAPDPITAKWDGTVTTTSGSKTVTVDSTASGSLAVGQSLDAPGLTSAVINQISGSTLTVSRNATATGSGVSAKAWPLQWSLPNSTPASDLAKWIKAIAYAGTNTPAAPACTPQPVLGPNPTPPLPLTPWYEPFGDYSKIFTRIEEQKNSP